MSIIDIINGNNIEETIVSILNNMHQNGPIEPADFEKLALMKKLHAKIFSKYEKKLMYVLGLFYKTTEPTSLIEVLYNTYSETIKDYYGTYFTPVQADAQNHIETNRVFSFSAPTSIGKSYLFRWLIKEYKKDIVIIVPSRALISEYMYEIFKTVDKSVLVLQFVENINIKHTSRRIFVLTPERASELFKQKKYFDVGLFLFDEAQISEENIRGMRFDALVNRIETNYPNAKKVFTHPFVSNPEAQLKKHNFYESASSQRYKQQVVGKIYMTYGNNKFSYFSPFSEGKIKKHVIDHNPVEDVLKRNGTLLIYTSKITIYTEKHLEKFASYIDMCEDIKKTEALNIIKELEEFLGITSEKTSLMINMMRKGIVIHHGSIPLHGRLLIEKFIKNGFAKICFATSTLAQGINMPFDVVWIDNFNFGRNESEDTKTLTLKNLIGRAGRSSNIENYFDYGYVIINDRNTQSFCTRIKKNAELKSSSQLDEPISNIPEDLKDLAEAIKNNSFDEENQLPLSQIERIEKADIHSDIQYILENIFENGVILTGKKYYNLPSSIKEKMKKGIINIYKSHLRRADISKGEKSVLSTSIPILLWRVQGRSFSAIVASRYAYITRADDRRKILEILNNRILSDNDKKQILELYTENKEEIAKILSQSIISEKDKNKIIQQMPLKFTQKEHVIPDSQTKNISIFSKNSTYKDFKYDILVYDTYDYLDKVISFSLIPPLCAAFQKYYEETSDSRALIIKNYIKYGTNDETEIYLQQYGFGFEEIEWLKPYIAKINQNEIIFYESINDLPNTKRNKFERYLYDNNIIKSHS